MTGSSQSGDGLPFRRSARVVLIDPRDRVFFFRSADPASVLPTRHWFLPGGGLEPGETFVEAAIRELREEMGQIEVEIGPSVWLRDSIVHLFGRPTHSYQRYFVAYTDTSDVDIGGLHGYELTAYGGHRWWSFDELRDTDEIVFPEPIAELLEPILAGNLPDEPLWIE